MKTSKKIKQIKDQIKHHETMKKYVIRNYPRKCHVKCEEIDNEIERLNKKLENLGHRPQPNRDHVELDVFGHLGESNE